MNQQAVQRPSVPEKNSWNPSRKQKGLLAFAVGLTIAAYAIYHGHPNVSNTITSTPSGNDTHLNITSSEQQLYAGRIGSLPTILQKVLNEKGLNIPFNESIECQASPDGTLLTLFNMYNKPIVFTTKNYFVLEGYPEKTIVISPTQMQQAILAIADQVKSEIDQAAIAVEGIEG